MAAPRQTLSLSLPNDLLLFLQLGDAPWGTLIEPGGHLKYVIAGEIEVQTLEYWVSPKSKIKYPVRLRIQIPSLALDLDCRAVLNHQEIEGRKTTLQNYWAGALHVGVNGKSDASESHDRSEKHSSDQYYNGFMTITGLDRGAAPQTLQFLTQR